MGPVIYRSGTVSLVSFMPEEQQKVNVLGVGKAPILEGDNIAVSMILDKKNAKILWEMMKMPTPPVSITLDMIIAGYQSPVEFSIEMDFSKIYNHETFQGAFGMPIFSAEINKTTQELKESGAIRVTMIGEDQAMEKVMSTIENKLIDMCFTSFGSEQGAKWDALSKPSYAGGKSMLDDVNKNSNALFDYASKSLSDKPEPSRASTPAREERNSGAQNSGGNQPASVSKPKDIPKPSGGALPPSSSQPVKKENVSEKNSTSTTSNSLPAKEGNSAQQGTANSPISKLASDPSKSSTTITKERDRPQDPWPDSSAPASTSSSDKPDPQNTTPSATSSSSNTQESAGKPDPLNPRSVSPSSTSPGTQTSPEKPDPQNPPPVLQPASSNSQSSTSQNSAQSGTTQTASSSSSGATQTQPRNSSQNSNSSGNSTAQVAGETAGAVTSAVLGAATTAATSMTPVGLGLNLLKSIKVSAVYQTKSIKHQGKYTASAKHYFTTSLPEVFSGNIGKIDCAECFREINLWDPLYVQREITTFVDGDTKDFEQYINYVTLAIRKKHPKGDITTDDIRVDRVNFNTMGNNFRVMYGWMPGDADRKKWLDYEYKIQWSFFGGGTIDSAWTPTTQAAITLTPPLIRRSVKIEADSARLAEQDVRVIDVRIFYSLGGQEQVKQVTLVPSKDMLATEIDFAQLKNSPAYEYEINWLLNDNSNIESGRKAAKGNLLYVDALPRK